jgi:hypothetical protein
VNSGQLFYRGPLSGDKVLDLGASADWASAIGCSD